MTVDHDELNGLPDIPRPEAPVQDTRFKPGVSGNPRGRPRRRKTDQSFLETSFTKLVPIVENGRTRKAPLYEVMISKLQMEALKGNMKAMALMLELCPEPLLLGLVQSGEEQSERRRGMLEALFKGMSSAALEEIKAGMIRIQQAYPSPPPKPPRKRRRRL